MRKNILKITIITILLVFVCATIVNAYSFTATMTPSSTTIQESSEFTVKIKVSNLDVGTNGINSLSGYLKYDDKVFETINESSFSGLNGWANQGYNAENEGKVTFTKSTFVKSEEDVFQITFKTKEGTNGKSGQIRFTTIVASNSASEITASDISITVNVGESVSNPDDNPANNNVNENTNTNTNTNTNAIQAQIRPSNNTANTNSNNTNTNNTNTNNNNNVVPSYVNSSNISAEDNMPYTGVEDTIMYLIGGIIVLAIVFYIKFEKINKEIR